MSDSTEATGLTGAPQTFDAVETALARATMYALAQGNRYTQARRKTVANAFYSALPLLAEVRRVYRETAPQAAPSLHESDVQWIVNDNAELGVMIHGQAFFLYKGDSLVYEDPRHDDGRPMHYRTVGKREFGECCHPVNYKSPELIGTVSLSDSDRWKPLPAGRCVSTPQAAPAGMVLVPREPTQDMLSAGKDELIYATHNDRWKMALSAWAAMLAAAPAAQVAEQIDVAGWVVADGQGKRWRFWGDTGPEWTTERDKALRFARRCDAEAFAREDEDAWLIQPIGHPAAAPAVVVDEVAKRERVTDAKVRRGALALAKAEGWVLTAYEDDILKSENLFAQKLVAKTRSVLAAALGQEKA